MKNKNYLLLFFMMVLVIFSENVNSQDILTDEKQEKDNRPINPPFDAGILIDNQTVVVPSANTLEFMIQHRFGTINSNTFDLAGLYAPSNIRIGLSYSLTDYLQVGLGSTKNNKLQDVNWKLRILRQTRSNRIPVAVTYYGNVETSVRENENFGLEYAFAHRLSYFHQLIVARKINMRLSVQASIQFTHFNLVDTIAFPGLQHNNLGVSLNGKYKITPQLGVIFAYDMPLTTPEIIKPNANLGIEISTLGHSFQIFLGSYSKISPQSNMTLNMNDFTKMDILLGFNINRLWKF
ncbi:MAG: DUF5777 family beta-barrel protein [Bacteroidales bacterium]